MSIEDEFGPYSPGVVLINETMKRMTTEQNIGNLDLSKGAEGYKLSMGGTLYHTYDITLTKQTD
jgi:CelD/BcsL family acetyltransferase involved in cellulose biosynthesis